MSGSEFFRPLKRTAELCRRDEQVAAADLPRDPRTATVAFPEFRQASERAGNMGFWGGGHEKTIPHARKPPAPGLKPRPPERHAIGHHFAGEIPGKSGGGAAFGRGHVSYHYIARADHRPSRHHFTRSETITRFTATYLRTLNS